MNEVFISLGLFTYFFVFHIELFQLSFLFFTLHYLFHNPIVFELSNLYVFNKSKLKFNLTSS